MNAIDEIRYAVVVARLESLQKDYDLIVDRLSDIKRMADWIDHEMAELWIEKAALERSDGNVFRHATK